MEPAELHLERQKVKTVQVTSMVGIHMLGRTRVRIMLASHCQLSSSTDLKKAELTRYFANHVSHSPACLHIVELILVQTEILLHPRHERIVDVDLVQILDEVPQ